MYVYETHEIFSYLALKQMIQRAKTEAVISEMLLLLRLTGYSYSRHLFYATLRRALEKEDDIVVIIKDYFNRGFIKYKGKILLFDRKCNILLDRVSYCLQGQYVDMCFDALSFLYIR